MNYRRLFLFTSVLGLVVSAAHRAPAATGSSVEASGYGGASDANWACGPRSEIRYGGVGAKVSLHPAPPEPPRALAPSLLPAADATTPGAPPPEGADVTAVSNEDIRDEVADLPNQGFAVDVSGAAEYRAFRLNRSGGDENETTLPPNGTRGAGGAKFGWDLRYFGVRGGMFVTQMYSENTSKSLTFYAWPELDLRFGNRRNFAFHAGTGSYDPVLLLHPALGYLGVEKRLPNGAELHAYSAITAASDAQYAGRLDLRAYVPLNDPDASGRFDLQFGFAGMLADTVKPEGRVGVRYGF